MHSVVAHKWACLVLLSGLSATLATPLPEDNLFAFAPSDNNLNTFSSEPLPVDGYSQDPLFTDYNGLPSGSVDNVDFSNDPLLGYNPSTDSGSDVALKAGDCLYGESVAEPGTVSAAGCPTTQPLQGCTRSGGTTVYPFDSRLPVLCAQANQQCCTSASGPASLSDCNRVAQSESIWDILGSAFNGAFPAAGGYGSGAGAGLGGIPVLGNKKRSGEFCAAADFS